MVGWLVCDQDHEVTNKNSRFKQHKLIPAVQLADEHTMPLVAPSVSVVSCVGRLLGVALGDT